MCAKIMVINRFEVCVMTAVKTVKEKANAKINLYLDVLSKRDDGFHDIKTIMHSVAFGDTVTVTAEPAKETTVRLVANGSKYLPTDARNLAVRAAELYLERAAITASVDITLDKRIPIAAGLAGGSSDAAATLRALNKIYGRLFSIRALNSIAAELGSDVVYCLYGKTALCEGRGEILTKINNFPELYVVIAVANEHVSTPAAYKKLDELFSNFDGSVPTGGDAAFVRVMDSLNLGKIDPDGLFNVFEKAVLPECPGAARAKERLLSLGARAAMMSGSGPSVFGLFSSFEEARSACGIMRHEKYKAYYARSVRAFSPSNNGNR